jgi:hypothetical protein
VDANLLKGEFVHPGAILDCCFHDDSSGFSAGADHNVRRFVSFPCSRLSCTFAPHRIWELGRRCGDRAPPFQKFHVAYVLHIYSRLLFRNFMCLMFYIFTPAPAQSTETISVNEAEQAATMGSGLRGSRGSIGCCRT